MKYERRSKKDGSGVYYSFITSDRKRLTKEEIRNRFGKDIITEEDAKHCVKLLEANFEAKKLRIQKRITWEQEYYNFAKLLEQYAVDQKKTAPNSWQNNVFYLKHYVLYYFLQVEKLNNVESWSDNFEGFISYLETAKTVRTNRPIAYQSKNHAIKALNTFLTHLEKKGLIAAAKRCDTFPEHLMNTRTIDDVIYPEEMESVFNALLKLNFKLEAILFRYLFFSGMRFNESLCLSLGDLYQGTLDNEFLEKKMNAYNLKYFGYIVSEGQFGGVKGTKVIRLPFKGQKTIAEKFNRIVPITDKVLWNLLVELAETVHANSAGLAPKDCLLFADIDDATATRRLEAAFVAAKLKYRSWHCLRHSRATWLIGATGDTMLARLWLGHSSPRTIEKYNHIYQAISRAAKTQKTSKKFNLKKV